MANPSPWIPDDAWKVLDRVLGALGIVITVVGGFLFRRLQGHIAMLLVHQDKIDQHEVDLGQYKAHRELASKGPIGEELKRKLGHIHTRIDELEDKDSQIQISIAEIKGDVKAISQAVERIEKAVDRIESR